MLNTEAFVLLAGNPEKYDEECRRLKSGGAYGSLPKLQEVQHASGFRSAELQRSIYGWVIRSGSGLDGFSIMFTPDQGTVDKGFQEAYIWGVAWAQNDRDNREFYMRRDYFSSGEFTYWDPKEISTVAKSLVFPAAGKDKIREGAE